MAFFGRWTKRQILSAGCLLSFTVLVMVVSFTAEDMLLFPARCNHCDILWDQPAGVLLKIGETRPLLQRHPLVEHHNLAGYEDSSSNSQPRSKVSHEVTVEVKNNVVQGSEVDPTEKLGRNVRKDNHSKVDNGKTQNKYQLRGAGLEIQEEKEAERAKSKLDSQGELKADSSPPPSPQPSQPSEVHSVQYYSKNFTHPVAELRLLTAKDGAPRLRSNTSPPDREITIVTQTSADRLPALEAACMTWGGAMCVAVHVRLESEISSVYEQVKQMHARVEEQSGCRLEVQLVTEDGFKTEEDALRVLYPVNALRNVALEMAKTKLVFLLDADFKPSPRLHESLTEEVTYQDLVRQATEDSQLFVVPAFEAASVKGRKLQVTVPESMEELKDGWEKKTIQCFHCQKYRKGHVPTNFGKFFNSTTTRAYSIAYRDGFEPYVIGALDRIPPYDARFRGYGRDKVSHLYSCAADGMGFQVLPNVFVFELPHPPSQAHDSYIGKHKDPEESSRVAGLYIRFKFELKTKQMKKDPDRYREFLSSLSKKE